jgi:aconitate hydratase
VAGKEVYQTMVGSSANPGLRDFAITAQIVKGKQINERVSLDIIPTSRQILENLTEMGHISNLVHAGGRIHQPGCNGCIGMGQAPATNKISLRTVPRNFPGRSGTKDDLVYLCSPETAAAAALTGKITDPRKLKMKYPKFKEPQKLILNPDAMLKPKHDPNAKLEMGPNIKPLPMFPALEEHIEGPVLLKMGDNISTDEISPAGTKVLPFRSNIPELSKFTFSPIDEKFYERAMKHQKTGSLLIAGSNYGQGSSREHAAISPRFMGVRCVIAKSYARIHRKNLINFGILPLLFDDEQDLNRIDRDDILEIRDLKRALKSGQEIKVLNKTKGKTILCRHSLSPKEMEELIAGGLINHILARKRGALH